MSDLRTRIAAVLLDHSDNPDSGPDCTCGWEWHGYGLWKDEYAGHLADAVIRDVLTPDFLADLLIAAVQKAADDE